MWEAGTQRARARQKLWAAVLFLDDFTGKPIGPGVLQVCAEELGTAPVSKQDGWYLFLNYGGSVLTVHARGRCYNEKTAVIRSADLDALNPVVRIRLTPNRSYAAASHAAGLEGVAEPDRDIRLWCCNDPRPLRLLCDYAPDGPREGRQLQLYDPNGTDPEGRTFALLRRGSRKAELFSVCQRLEDTEGGCLLTAPLQSGCRKAGASVFPVYEARTDAGGSFFLLLPGPGVRELECRIRVEQPDAAADERALKLEPGRLSYVNLRRTDG